MENQKYVPVIGLEVHVELKTKSKMFCGCSADYFGKEPNTHVCPVCLGLPGALPVPNKKAIEWCVMTGLALNCEIPLFSKFDRKNYFYPDLSKGYQISQYDKPFCVNGHIVIARSEATKQSPTGSPRLASRARDDKKIRIRRVHMEEDTAKLTHQFGSQIANRKSQIEERYSLIDFNRSGVPLVEIVTEPDFESAEEVVTYLKKLQQIVRYLGVSNADMEKGDMRLEPNISLRINDEGLRIKGLPKYKVEVKNINSFKFVDRAIAYEIKRQSELLEKGEIPKQETRGYNEAKNATLSQRSKEEAHDYRYFPEPDIPPVRWTEAQIANRKSQIGELPWEKLERFKKQYGLPDYDSEILTREKEKADYFEEAVTVGRGRRAEGEEQVEAKTIANWIINKKVDANKILPAELVKTIMQSTATVAVDEDELNEVIRKVLEDNQKAVEDFKNGKESAIMYLVGQVMRKIKKKIDAALVKETIERILKENNG